MTPKIFHLTLSPFLETLQNFTTPPLWKPVKVRYGRIMSLISMIMKQTQFHVFRMSYSERERSRFFPQVLCLPLTRERKCYRLGAKRNTFLGDYYLPIGNKEDYCFRYETLRRDVKVMDILLFYAVL
ncbi:hypothetical protein NPIL_665251 [Nephila pilipes]|uniref:Uncharacterized protein n=1 Tax=Nephila pilipes TaxID=299642 RepID=A0A8X6J970_NEPPI|nr:hypothetical protein NPIL_665251 [Nephila pilipes]